MLARLLPVALVFVAATAVAQPQPHRTRSGENLLQDPSFATMDGWSLDGAVAHDTTVGRAGAGDSSVRLEAPYPAYLASGLVPVEEGKTYTLAAYLRTAAWPNWGSLFCSIHAADGSWIRNLEGSRQATTGADVWEESAVLCTIPEGENVAYAEAHVLHASTPYDTRPLWVDDAYFGEGIGFAEPPAPKQAFEGTQTRVDALGNFEVWDGAAWQPFLPFCICPDNRREDWGIYAEGGFNCQPWAWNASGVRAGRDAGLMSMVEVGHFIAAGEEGYSYNYTLLGDTIRALVDEDVMGSVLAYYFDNETYQQPGFDPAHPELLWEAARDALDTVEQTELEVNGGERMVPRYMLLGNEGAARMYGTRVDVVGDYISGESGGVGAPSTEGLVILDNVQAQAHPYFAQINHPQTAQQFRQSVYLMVIAGARGFSYWRDLAPGEDPGAYELVPIETTDWFTELPIVRQELEQAIDVVRAPHWTSWSASSSERAIRLGTRDHGGEGYLIAVNVSLAPVTTSVELSELPYVPTDVQDFLAGASVATPSGASFSLELPAAGTGIYRLVNPEPQPDGGVGGAYPDAGVGGAGSGGAGPGAAGAMPGGGPGSDESGCGCRLADASRSFPLATPLTVLGLWLGARRRREPPRLLRSRGVSGTGA